MIENDERLAILVANGQQIAPAPEVVRFPLDKLAGCFPRLLAQFRLLVADPADFEIA